MAREQVRVRRTSDAGIGAREGLKSLEAPAADGVCPGMRLAIRGAAFFIGFFIARGVVAPSPP